MKAARYLRFGVIGVAMLGAGSVLADDPPLPTDPAQGREQMQERVRNMTPEEQKLMRETRSDGRARMENQPGEGARQRSRDGSAQAGGYGQGYESRRGDASGSGGGGGGG